MPNSNPTHPECVGFTYVVGTKSCDLKAPSDAHRFGEEPVEGLISARLLSKGSGEPSQTLPPVRPTKPTQAPKTPPTKATTPKPTTQPKPDGRIGENIL